MLIHWDQPSTRLDVCNSQHSVTWGSLAAFRCFAVLAGADGPITAQDLDVLRAICTCEAPTIGEVPRDYRSSPALEKCFVISAAIFCSPRNCLCAGQSIPCGQ